MYQSETLSKLAPALVKAQAEMGVAYKDSTNPHFRSKYADLTSIITASRDALTANGLSVLQRAYPNDRGIQIETMILHASGEWISDGGLFLPAAKLDPQGFGSAMTYARRYAYAAMLGIIQDDDDGNAATLPRRKPGGNAEKPEPKSAVDAIASTFDATPVKSDPATDAALYVFPFGKHKGKTLAEVDESYLRWLLAQPAKEGYEKQHAEAHAMYQAELDRRAGGNA